MGRMRLGVGNSERGATSLRFGEHCVHIHILLF